MLATVMEHIEYGRQTEPLVILPFLIMQQFQLSMLVLSQTEETVINRQLFQLGEKGPKWKVDKIWRLMHVQFRFCFQCRGVLLKLIIMKNCPKIVWNSSSSETFSDFPGKNLWRGSIVTTCNFTKEDFNRVDLLGIYKMILG